VVRFKYDYRGRRLLKTASGTTTLYCYAGDQVIAEYEYDSQAEEYELVRKFIYGPGIDEPIMMVDVDGQGETEYHYHYDGRGSVAAITATTGNSLVEYYRYDVYGKVTMYDSSDSRIYSSTVDNPYYFTGRRP